MPRATSVDRRLRAAILPAFFAGAAGFGLTWLLLMPPARISPQPSALLRLRQSTGAPSDLATDQAVSRLLSSETLADTLAESGLLADRINPAVASAMVETVRDSVRVDIRDPDEAGVQEVRIRWVGDPEEKLAGALVKALCRRLATRLATTDHAEPRRAYEAAHSELAAAETALTDARSEFEAALKALGGVRPGEFAPQSRKQATVGPPAKPLPNVVEADEAHLARQRLAELEQRRQLLADRLMPEHPEMKALDEKIEELRAATAHRSGPATPPRPPLAEIPPDTRVGEDVDDKQIARSRELWQAMLDAQNRYAAALAQERDARHFLSPSPVPAVAEIESSPQNALAVRQAEWRRWLLSALAALACGGLVLALWPGRQQTFASAEEVRLLTRLPVVVLESASLN